MQFDIIALWFCLDFIMPGTQLAPVLEGLEAPQNSGGSVGSR